MDSVYSQGVINERNWDLLFDAIEKERVVPIIGGEFFYTEDENKHLSVKVEDYALEHLKEHFHFIEKDADFTVLSDIIEEENFRSRRSRFIGSQTDIYFEIDNILRGKKVECRPELLDFLSIHRFPLILTTSSFSDLETDLKTQYDDVDIKIYNKSARSDINTFLSSQKPTIYYLFGKVNRIKKSFLVTEDDLLDYLHLWHNAETRPSRLGDYLKDKFLLVLGCNYPNWLFRFFWHSIRNFTLIPNTYEMQGVIALEHVDADKELTNFLSRIQTQIFENSMNFIEEFMRRWNARKKEDNVEENYRPNENTDIFISYAKEDVDTVRGIVERMRKFGADVWFDENNLEWSDLYESIIEEKITRAKRFVPIISQTTMQQERRFFRREWAMAIREMDYRFGMPYFAPIIIDNSDMNSPLIPEPFRKTHIISCVDEDFETELKKLIRSFR